MLPNVSRNSMWVNEHLEILIAHAIIEGGSGGDVSSTSPSSSPSGVSRLLLSLLFTQPFSSFCVSLGDLDVLVLHVCLVFRSACLGSDPVGENIHDGSELCGSVFSAHASVSQREEPLSSVSVVLRHRCVPSAEGFNLVNLSCGFRPPIRLLGLWRPSPALSFSVYPGTVEYAALADVVTSWFYLLSSWQWFGGFHREQVVQMRFMLFMKKSSALLALLHRSLQEPRLVLAH
ncbi:hypothetical protein DY000_02015293 [Brassica cretica]|uniref:Uncharacterized protein n=1 Tax=Brassica cretica TaxID=69181 RepID=A0ABQ7D1W0_BRACR|nr:hypothetical protein DY000_02015293 [Brassica cretica]